MATRAAGVATGTTADDPGGRLAAARSACPDFEEWQNSLHGQIGWTTLAAITGDVASDAQESFTKINLRLTDPVPFTASFVFHLDQTLDAIAAVCNGGLVATATLDLVRYLETATFADALDTLPLVYVPASQQLTQVVQYLQGASR